MSAVDTLAPVILASAFGLFLFAAGVGVGILLYSKARLIQARRRLFGAQADQRDELLRRTRQVMGDLIVELGNKTVALPDPLQQELIDLYKLTERERELQA